MPLRSQEVLINNDIILVEETELPLLIFYKLLLVGVTQLLDCLPEALLRHSQVYLVVDLVLRHCDRYCPDVN